MKRSKFWIMIMLCGLALVAIASGKQVTSAQADQVTVNMQDFAFVPANITVHVGGTVTWANTGTKKHTATADDNSFDTGVVAPGASSQAVTFTKAGTFKYFCQFHGGPDGVDMSGTITVVADAAVASPQAATQVPAAAQTAAPQAASAASVGTVTFADKVKGARADSVTFTITNLPLPDEGKQYEAWLANDTSSLSLGILSVKADGTATLTYVDPKGTNLIGVYQSALISVQGNDLTPVGPIAYSGTIPPQALIHVRHVDVSFPD